MLGQCNSIIGAGVVFTFALSAQAGVILPEAPAGYSSHVTVYGSAGVARDASRWFTSSDGQAQHTNWANKPIDFHVNLGDIAQDFTLGVTGKNETPLVLPPNYSQFKVGVSLNDTFLDYLHIDASDTEWNTSLIDVGELAGDAKLTLNWVNDSYKKGVHDANFAVGAVQFLTFGASGVAALAPEIPAPGSGALALASLILAAPRRSRRSLAG